jgi:hypothetical protein
MPAPMRAFFCAENSGSEHILDQCPDAQGPARSPRSDLSPWESPAGLTSYNLAGKIVHKKGL